VNKFVASRPFADPEAGARKAYRTACVYRKLKSERSGDRDRLGWGIRDKPTSPASPSQNGFAERLIGVDPPRVLGS
jgi:hypothetical protein